MTKINNACNFAIHFSTCWWLDCWQLENVICSNPRHLMLFSFWLFSFLQNKNICTIIFCFHIRKKHKRIISIVDLYDFSKTHLSWGLIVLSKPGLSRWARWLNLSNTVCTVDSIVHRIETGTIEREFFSLCSNRKTMINFSPSISSHKINSAPFQVSTISSVKYRAQQHLLCFSTKPKQP